MKEKTLVSIITVVYNGAKTLEQTIQSVINQTYKNIEYIIIDGESTDGTLDIIKKYEKHISILRSEPDKGLYDAMNKGIQLANGELIGMINSDDWYELDAVEIMTNQYLANPDKKIFHADRYNVLTNGEKEIYRHNPSVLKFKFHGMTYNHPSMFVTKEEYCEHLYNINLKGLSDYQFVLEAYLNDKTKFHYVPKTIVNYRLDGLSAEMPLKTALKEGFKARKLARMNLFYNLFSVGLRFFLVKVKKIRNE